MPNRELFRRFKVTKFLGSGAYGSVYRASRIDDGQVYAVKEADIGKMSPQQRADCAREIKLLAAVKHPNIIRYHEAFLDGNWLCIIMEYASAGDLSFYIQRGKERRVSFPEDIVWSYIIQSMQGIGKLHSLHILHRDLKPMNLFVGSNHVIKVGDLGIATRLQANAAAHTQIGTPQYMAPEVWREDSYSFKADVWSLGCVLYEMMTYRVPFQASSVAEVKGSILNGIYPEISTNYSSALKRLCAAMLEVDPDRRPSIEELLSWPEVLERMHLLPIPEGGAGSVSRPISACAAAAAAKVRATVAVADNVEQRIPAGNMAGGSAVAGVSVANT